MEAEGLGDGAAKEVEREGLGDGAKTEVDAISGLTDGDGDGDRSMKGSVSSLLQGERWGERGGGTISLDSRSSVPAMAVVAAFAIPRPNGCDDVSLSESFSRPSLWGTAGDSEEARVGRGTAFEEDIKEREWDLESADEFNGMNETLIEVVSSGDAHSVV